MCTNYINIVGKVKPDCGRGSSPTSAVVTRNDRLPKYAVKGTTELAVNQREEHET